MRWDTISASVDDRTEEEMRPREETIRGEFEAGEFMEEEGGGEDGGVRRQPKSR